MNDTTLSVTPETLPAIMWQNQPVITTELLAQIYGAQEKQIRQNFANNTSRFIEGVHFFKLVGAELKAFKRLVDKIDSAIVSKFTQSLMLWTERGTVRHAKILDTDNAWVVQDRLEDFYFTKNQPKRNGLVDLPTATPKTITPAMQRQIQKAIGHLVKTQIGTTYSGLYGQIKDKFDVGSYKDVPFKRYGELCEFLNIQPIEGELVEPSALPYQPPKGMVLIAENELETLRKTPAPIVQKVEPIPAGCVVLTLKEYDAFKKLDDIVSGIRFSLNY